MAFRFVKNIWANLRQLADNNIWQIVDSVAPTNGVTGAGFAGPGSVYTNTATGNKYSNTGTIASPTWIQLTRSVEIVGSGIVNSGNGLGVSVPVLGALVGDIVLANWVTTPTNLRIIVAKISAPDTLDISFANPVGVLAGDIRYVVLRQL